MHKADNIKTPLLNSEDQSIPLGIEIPNPEENNIPSRRSTQTHRVTPRQRENSDEVCECDCGEMCIDCVTCLFLSTITIVAIALLLLIFL